jgi:hypothetical protein
VIDLNDFDLNDRFELLPDWGFDTNGEADCWLSHWIDQRVSRIAERLGPGAMVTVENRTCLLDSMGGWLTATGSWGERLLQFTAPGKSGVIVRPGSPQQKI